MRRTLQILMLGSLIVLAGCSKEESKENKQVKEDIVLQDKIIESKITPDSFSYSQEGPGGSQRFDRSYENAPPLVPHSLEGLLPITKDNNACVGCHMPDIAGDMGATPIPKSHFYNLRDNKDLKDTLSNARFNCTQCHVPQSDAKDLFKGNSFTPSFRSEDFKHHSDYFKTIHEK